MSSAYVETVEFWTNCGTSLMKHKEKTRGKTEPWETPTPILSVLELKPSTRELFSLNRIQKAHFFGNRHFSLRNQPFQKTSQTSHVKKNASINSQTFEYAKDLWTNSKSVCFKDRKILENMTIIYLFEREKTLKCYEILYFEQLLQLYVTKCSPVLAKMP